MFIKSITFTARSFICFSFFSSLNLFANEIIIDNKDIPQVLPDAIADRLPDKKNNKKTSKKTEKKSSNSQKKNSEPAHLEAEYYHVKTTDKVEMDWATIGYRNRRRELVYPYPGESKTGWEYGCDGLFTNGYSSRNYFTSGRFSLMGGRKFSENFQTEIKAGAHEMYDTAARKKNLIFTGEIMNYFIFMDFMRGYFSANHDYAFIYLIMPAGVSDHLTTTNLNTRFNIRYSDSFQTVVRSNYYFISDGNRKFVIDANLLYGISTGTPWIWAGVGAEKTTNTQYSPDYWTPWEFFAYGLRSEAVFPLFGDFSGFLSANYHKLKDKESQAKGKGYDLTVKLTYGEREYNNISLYALRIKSEQSGQEWISDQMGVSANIFF